MNCSKCGAALAGAAFCAACGTPANVVASNPTPAAPTDFQVPPMPYGAPAAKTNGMAIAALVTSLAGSFCGVGFLGLVFGLIALNQIKKSDGAETGKGMAIAGVIIGGLNALAVIYLFAMFSAVSIGGPDGF